MITQQQVIEAAKSLRSVNGENPEYDRALVELTALILDVPVEEQDQLFVETREEKILESAIEGLREYYACLNYKKTHEAIAAAVKIPNTGNDQIDYENTKAQVEKIAQEHEALLNAQ